MKTKILTLLMLFITFSATAQTLTLAELQNLCKLSNWQTGNDILTRKGWEFYGSDKGDASHYASISFAYDISDWNGDYASGWARLYIDDDGHVARVYYNGPNAAMNTIKNSLTANGYKRINSEIDDGNIITIYANNSFELKFTTFTSDTQFGGTKASSSIILSRK
ncbi:MAG: hypothetical protein J6T70_00645 [Bacteroidales bacterium]|nr:hypothetical protein [Bacteroidales bacterium]